MANAEELFERQNKSKYEQSEFDTAFNEAMQLDSQEKENETSETPSNDHLFSDFISPLGTKITEYWEEAERDRDDADEAWLQDLRQYRGEYDSDIKDRIHPKRSQAFMRLTRTKVKTMDARLTDILFPANGEDNWGIEPTPIPTLDPEIVEELRTQIMEQTGLEDVSETQIDAIVNEEATIRSTNMKQAISDQLAELKYRETMRKVLHSGNLYGTGILKGPLAKEKVSKRWFKKDENSWGITQLRNIIPYCEFVPVWDIYPDMSATEVEHMRYIFQRYVMNRNKVLELASRSDFNGNAIRAYLKAYPDGDSHYKYHENELRGMSSKRTAINGEDAVAGYRKVKKYEVKEFWGYLSTDELIEAGVEIPEDKLDMEIAANVWMLGPLVIKAVISPIEGVEFPYHFYYFEKDETSIFGQGIANIVRDPQKLTNAAIRALLDNAAISAGPIIEANIDLLAEGEDATDIYPFRVFQRNGTGIESNTRAIHVNELRSHTREFLDMVQFFLTVADEVTTIPRYMWGEASQMGSGAGRTASGLSMLMGSANITLKDQVKNFDDGVTKPFIRAMYFWNMEFNKDPEVKGDYAVVAKGTTSLIAKEVQLEALNQALALTNNPVDLRITNRDVILRKVFDALDLGDLNLIKTPEQIAAMEEAEQQMGQIREAQALELEKLKAASGGHVQMPTR